MRRTHIVAVALALTLVVGFVAVGGLPGGNAGDEDDAAEPRVTQEEQTFDSAADAEGADAGEAPDDGNVELTTAEDSATGDRAEAQLRRELIRTGTVELRVEDVEGTVDDLSALARTHGGYVSESSRQVHAVENESYATGTLVLRVPSEDFQTVYEEVREHGEVEASASSTEDVTDQLVDIEARLENLRAERDRLRALYEDASDTRDVLAVQEELASVQQEIERLEAQQRSLEDRVAMATIHVELSEPAPEPDPEPEPEETAWYEVGLLDAFVASVGNLLVAGRAALVVGAYAAPFVAIGLPIAGAIYAFR